MIEDTPKSRPKKEVMHDEAPSVIIDHPFTPKGEWWSLCGYKGCNLAESAHSRTTILRYYSDDVPEVHE